MSLKLFNYTGTKIKYVELINEQLKRQNCEIYIEPFCGSAAVFFNLEREYEIYILNDVDTNVIRILKSFQDSTFEQLQFLIDKIKNDFGDIKQREFYYNFRQNFNSNHHKNNTIEEGFYLWILFNSCINSIARFGPKGFNQSFGCREGHSKLTKQQFEIIQKRLSKTTLLNLPFKKLVSEYSDFFDERTILFLDPPYTEKPIAYSNLNNDDFKAFIDFIKHTNCKVIYTDTRHNYLDWDSIVIRTMRNVSPNRKTEFTIDEILYKNF